MVTRTVHAFNPVIQLGAGELVRHTVTFSGASAAFTIDSVPPGQQLLNQHAPGPPFTREWRLPADAPNPNPVHGIGMAFVQAIAYRWLVERLASDGTAAIEVDVEYASNNPTDHAFDTVKVMP